MILSMLSSMEWARAPALYFPSVRFWHWSCLDKLPLPKTRPKHTRILTCELCVCVRMFKSLSSAGRLVVSIRIIVKNGRTKSDDDDDLASRYDHCVCSELYACWWQSRNGNGCMHASHQASKDTHSWHDQEYSDLNSDSLFSPFCCCCCCLLGKSNWLSAFVSMPNGLFRVHGFNDFP